MLHLSTDSWRNGRIKYLATLPTAPFIVKSAVKALGGEKPVIMGKVRKGILIYFLCEIRLCSAGISNSLSREPFLGVFNAETLYWE